MLRDDKLEVLLQRSRADHFDAGFSGRVMRRTETAQQSLGLVLQRYFIWMVPAAVTAIAVLAMYNARSAGSDRQGLDRLLALQTVTLDAAYTVDTGTSAP